MARPDFQFSALELPSSSPSRRDRSLLAAARHGNGHTMFLSSSSDRRRAQPTVVFQRVKATPSATAYPDKAHISVFSLPFPGFRQVVLASPQKKTAREDFLFFWGKWMMDDEVSFLVCFSVTTIDDDSRCYRVFFFIVCITHILLRIVIVKILCLLNRNPIFVLTIAAVLFNVVRFVWSTREVRLTVLFRKMHVNYRATMVRAVE